MVTDNFGNKYYKLALHLHTTLSDGKKTPSEVALEYKSDGFDAIAFTDHWHYGNGGELDGLLILSGCEYNLGISDTANDVMHIVGIGMERDPGVLKSFTRKEVVDAINSASGIAVLAHPAWSVNTVDDCIEGGAFCATEIYNAVSESHESMRAYSDYFVDAAANRNIDLKILATDDAHYYDGSDNRQGFVYVMADELSQIALISAIKSGKCFASQGPLLFATKEENKIIIDTSPCSIIATLSNKSWAKNRVLRGENLTHFEYEIKEDESWVRVEVRDSDNKRAWSNIFFTRKKI